MNWTPGPWKIDTDTQGYVVIVAGKRTVCLVGPEEDPTSETDAAAIVLLPELAQALKAVHTEMGRRISAGAFQEFSEPLKTKIQTILAKLEGGGK